MSLDSKADGLKIVRAEVADYDAVMAILHEAEDWLNARGIRQWNH